MGTLRHTPDMKLKELIGEAREMWGIKLSNDQAYRVKVKALDMIGGAISEQYHRLRSYEEEHRRSNPNSSVIIQCAEGAKRPVFERFYVCFEACKSAFVTTCRPLIGLDGCFLKGVYGGQLLAAIGKDGNNQMIPIAIAVVEAETKESWSWFVELLLQDLEGIQNKKFSFISDQQKGLVPTFQSLYNASVEHRLCVKHLYGNWRKKYPGLEMKELLWKAARATTIPEWQRAMENLKRVNESAWKYMMEIPPPCGLGLITAPTQIVIFKFVKLRELMLRYRGQICPMIQQQLEKLKKDSDGWYPNWAGDDGFALFEVSKHNEKYVVNLMDRTCSCRKWTLTGIPCQHAVAVMWSKNVVPENYVATHYRKNTFMATYSHIIMPSNGPKLWPTVDALPISPPYIRRAPGKPKKQRKKTNDEPRNPNKLPRQHLTVKCKRCGQLGHNIRTCKGKTTADRVIPKEGNKKNKKGPSTSTTNLEPQCSVPQTQTQATVEVHPSQVFEQNSTSTVTAKTSGIGAARQIPTLGVNATQESTCN